MANKEELVLKADPGFASYHWDGYGSTTENLKITQPGFYTVEITDANGCKASKTFEVIAYCKEISAPNAFSPNGDGINDVWKVSGLELEPNSFIQIFNRLGVQVFSTRGNKPVWDGKLGNTDAPVGIYYYVITSPNSAESKNGVLTLLR